MSTGEGQKEKKKENHVTSSAVPVSALFSS